MRYVIVCVVKGEAGRFNNELRRDIFKKFNAKSSKLPAHFTIKAPFEYEGSLKNLEEALYKFCNEEDKAPFTMDKYNHFDDRVIYMDVNMSKEGKDIHDRLIDVLDKFDYINFNKKDGKVLVEGVNMLTKHTKPSAVNQNGGIIHQEGPIDISNVMYVHKGKVTRIGFKMDGDK